VLATNNGADRSGRFHIAKFDGVGRKQEEEVSSSRVAALGDWSAARASRWKTDIVWRDDFHTAASADRPRPLSIVVQSPTVPGFARRALPRGFQSRICDVDFGQ
jgi:hypothetical protein